ncbi:hypothetical protein HYW59_04280 [Candidatus Kaiserbacteria bacterium]|nr:hypothetical protein [Candidatus Kaiserbacteria bacterium]
MTNENPKPWQGKIKDEKIAHAVANAELAIRDGTVEGTAFIKDDPAAVKEALDDVGQFTYFKEGAEIPRVDLPRNVLAAFVNHAAEKSIDIDNPDAIEFRMLDLGKDGKKFMMNYGFQKVSGGPLAGKHIFKQAVFDVQKGILQERRGFAQE